MYDKFIIRKLTHRKFIQELIFIYVCVVYLHCNDDGHQHKRDTIYSIYEYFSFHDIYFYVSKLHHLKSNELYESIQKVFDHIIFFLEKYFNASGKT